MSQLSFTKMVEKPGRGARTFEVAVPMIDGRPLFDFFDDRYAGVAMDLVAGTRHLLGEPTYGEDDMTVLLDGTCGYAGCCGVMAVVDIQTYQVVWRDFFARGAPTIPPRLHFEFDRDAYESTIRRLPDVPVLDEELWPLE